MGTLFDDINEIITEFNDYCMGNPEYFLSEAEIRNTLFRFLLDKLIHNGRYPNLYVGREYLVNSKPRVKYDIVIANSDKELLAAFEIKYSYSNVKKLLNVLLDDIQRLDKYSGESCICYLLFYNNFEYYPEDDADKIQNIELTPKINYQFVNLTQEKIKIIQEKYMMDYTPSYRA